MRRSIREIRRFFGTRAFSSSGSWTELGSFALNDSSRTHWSNLRKAEGQVDNAISLAKRSPKVIDWDMWKSEVSHHEILESLKTFYETQSAKYREILGSNYDKVVSDRSSGWEIYEKALVDCEAAVTRSEEIVADGARALWLSYNCPPLPMVEDGEWLDSDRYMQAVVAKQHFHNPVGAIVEEDSPKWKEVHKEAWHNKMSTFNDRSDTPVLYQYMDQLPSWEFYDIHRRAFLEHMLYFLVRTGKSYKMFPECPPWTWLRDIERLRFQYLNLMHERRSRMQIEKELKDCSIDLFDDRQAHEEESVNKLLNSEITATEFSIARLMANYCFLCYPFIPIQTVSAFQRTSSLYTTGGTFYSIGSDVNSVFFLPDKIIDDSSIPMDSANFCLNNLAVQGVRLLPGYATLLFMHADLVSKRGELWFRKTDEPVCDAFLRRLGDTHPSFCIYKTYVDELKERFSTATEIPSSEILETIQNIEKNYLLETQIHDVLQNSISPSSLTEDVAKATEISNLYTSGQLQKQIDMGEIMVFDTSGTQILDAETLMQSLDEYSHKRNIVLEAFKKM